MNKLTFCLACLFILNGFSATGQTNIPTSATGPSSATARPLPAVYGSTPLQYVRTYSPNKPITDTSLINMNDSVVDVGILTAYKDSYGRVMQSVLRRGSPLKDDLVSPAYWDEFGRKSVQYLTFSSQSGNNNDGKFKSNPYSQDSAFYKGLQPNDQINYGQEQFDGSPLDVPTKILAPGNSWGGAGIGKSYSHRTNTTSDSVHLWTIPIVNEYDLPVTSSLYQPGTLTVVEQTDEKGVNILRYLDAFGRTVLSKTQMTSSPAGAHTGWQCTYFVYDEMSHLRYVITPLAVQALNNGTNNWSLSVDNTINANLCYAYFFDSRGRNTVKRIPGGGKIYLAYDLYDRLVMFQDSARRTTSQWAFIQYDAESRQISTGIITSSLIKDSILAQAARSTSYPTLSGTYAFYTKTFYDDFNWISANSAPVSSSLVTTHINSGNFNTSYNTSPDYAQQQTVCNRMRGLVTGQESNILESTTYLWTVNIYDDHARIIQTHQINYSGGTDVYTQQYGFTGRLLRTHIQHQKSGNNPQTHTLLTIYTYDQVGRLTSLTKNLDSLGNKVVSQETYNEAGQLVTKVIGSTTSETQNYAFNIRGWLIGINQSYVNTAGSTSNFFGEALSYDYGFTNSQLNGVIAGLKWKTAGDGISRAYGFSYDSLNRLTKADFSQQNTGSTNWTNNLVDFTVSNLTYDANGNILTLKQRALEIGSPVTIDSLKYTYFTNSNQLQKVSDAISDNSPLGDFKDTSSTGNDYSYDADGNVNMDLNKHVYTGSGSPGIVFNVLNKADSIVMANRETIHYYYDASGNQLFKTVRNVFGSSPVTSSYLYDGPFVYLNDTLQYVLHEEGRVRYAQQKNSTTGALYYAYAWDYFIKDHQGNVRSVITEERDTSTYAATMEKADSATEAALFSNIYTPNNTVYAKPTGFDTDTSNHYVSRLNASTSVNLPAGPSLVLKVMEGDQVQISTYAYYNTAVQPPGSVNLLSSILAILPQGAIANSGGKLISNELTGVSNTISPGVTSFLNTGRVYDSTRPKAYLNWILFDDQFNYVASNSGVQQVVAGSSKQALVAPLQTVSKNGYLYVYLSNESPQDVYFDNLTIKYTTGALEQEQSYYPFQLPMAGISDKALLKSITPYKGNQGTELEEDFSLEYYNTLFRKFDPQIGRFAGADALAESNPELSPYHFSNNNPVLFEDPTGLVQTAPNSKPIPTVANTNALDPNANNPDDGSEGPYAEFWGMLLYGLFPGDGSVASSGSLGDGTGITAANLTWAINSYISRDGSTITNLQYTWYEPGQTETNAVNGILPISNVSDGWNKVGEVSDLASTDLDLAVNGLTGVQKLVNSVGGGTKFDVTNLGDLKLVKSLTVESAGKLIATVGVGVAVYEDIKHPNIAHSLDAAVGIATILVPGAGWAIGGTYLLVNLGFQYFTGESFGEWLDDKYDDDLGISN
jgi:RHS repeat-associated protein